MRRILLALMFACGSIATGASAQVSVGIGINVPGVSIGVNIPSYPELVQVPSYPVYYAPGTDSNLFFYDGMYWVYQSDNWYASTWYNGPWSQVAPMSVPVYVLRVPVSYYRAPPTYFGGWQRDAPPRWGDHWGRDWEHRRSGWDRWNRQATPPPAPLPVYQRQYAADRYPPIERQRALQNENYRYQPRDAVVKQHFRQADNRAERIESGERPQPPRSGRDESADRTPRPQATPRQDRNDDVARGGPNTVTRTTVPPPPRTHENAQRQAARSDAEAPRRAVAPPEREPQRRADPDREPQGRAAPPRSAPAQPEAPSGRPAQRGAAPAAPVPQERSERGPGQDKEQVRGDSRGQDKKN